MSETESHKATAAEPTRPGGWRLLRLAFAKATRDGLFIQSAALAFITTLSLIPLLATFSFVGARLFSEDQQRWVEGLGHLLPYSEDEILTHLQTFLEQAIAIRGVGFALLIASSLAIFSAVEKTLNHIWNVPENRPLRTRLISLAMVLFWGSLSFAATYSSLLEISEWPAFRLLREALPFELLPALFTILGLSMLYWLVPNTSVLFPSALVGALAAALLLQLLRLGFGLVIQGFQQNAAIYSGFALALYFMISLQLSWWIVLLGCEVAYCVQNAAYLSLEEERDALDGSWLGLAALVVVIDRFRAGEPLVPGALLAETLRLPASDLERTLRPLLEEGLLKASDGKGETGYLLSCDPYRLPLARLFALYEDGHEEILRSMDPELRRRLETLRRQLFQCRAGDLGEQTLAELFHPADPVAEPDRHRYNRSPSVGQ